MRAHQRVVASSAPAALLATLGLLFAAPATSQSSCTITWSGHGSTNSWSEPENWEPAEQPGPSDHVCILSPVTVAVFQNVGSVSTLSSKGTLLMLSESGLRITDSEEASTVASLVQSGGLLGGASPLAISGSFEWLGGEQLEGVTEVVSGGRLSIRQGSETLRAGRVLKVAKGAKAAMAAGARLELGEEASVENAGMFEVASSEGLETWIAESGGGGMFESPGAFVRSGGGSVSVGVPFDDEGAVSVSGGELRLVNGGSEAASATFSVAGSGGLLNLAGGAFHVTEGWGFSGRVAQTGGRLVGPLTVKGSFEWLGGEELEGVTEVVSGGKLSIGQGSAVLRGGRLLKVDEGARAAVAAGARLDFNEKASVENAGTFEVASSEGLETWIAESSGGGVFKSSGAFVCSGGGAVSVGAPFDDEGAVSVSGGELRLVNGGSEAASATFSVAGSGGLLNLAGGAFHVTEGWGFSGRVAQTGGRLVGPLTVKGSFEWLGGEQLEGVTEVVSGGRLSIRQGSETLRAGRQLNVNEKAATVMSPGSDLVVGEGAFVKNAGTFEVEGGEEYGTRISSGGGGGTFRNTGAFVRSQGFGTVSVSVLFDNEGVVSVSGGELRLEGGGAEARSAVFDVAGSEGLLSFVSGTFVLAEGLSFSGRVAQTGGTLKGPVTANGSFEWDGGEEREGVTEVTGGGRLAIGSGYEMLQAGRALKVDAGALAVMSSGSDLVVGEKAVVRNAGTFEVEGGEEEGSRITYGGPGSTFRNTGVFRRAEGDGRFVVGVPLYNEGTVDVGTGVLVASSYVQSAHGVLGVHIAGALLGTGFTQLEVEGAATLEGVLRVATEGGFHPERGQAFQVLLAATITGAFGSEEEVGSIGGGWSYTTTYGPTGIEAVVAGGPVPTSTAASLSGGGQTGDVITVPTGTAVTASASVSGANASAATGSIAYRIYSDPSCASEVANAGTVAVGGGAPIASSNQEVFSAGTYYWQATYSGDSTSQRSSTPCGTVVENVPAPAAAGGAGGVLSSIEALPPPVSGRTANVAPVSGVVQVQLPGSHRLLKLTSAKSVPEGTIINTAQGFVALCRASEEEKQCAEFNGGEFRIEEKKNAPATQLALTGGDFSGCRASRRGGTASAAGKRAGSPERKLWGSGHGHFTTDGRNSATTVRGTIWSVEDRCASTVTKVMRGVVSVFDYRLHRTFQVSAGHSYAARAR